MKRIIKDIHIIQPFSSVEYSNEMAKCIKEAIKLQCTEGKDILYNVFLPGAIHKVNVTGTIVFDEFIQEKGN